MVSQDVILQYHFASEPLQTPVALKDGKGMLGQVRGKNQRRDAA